MIKKLSAQKTHRQKQKRNQLYLGIGLSLLMLFSVFGVMVNSFGSEEEQEKIIYKGQEFIQKNSVYELKIGDSEFYFTENPNNINDANYDVNLTKKMPDYVAKPLYLDTAEYEVTREIYQNMEGYPLRIQNACYDKDDCPSEDFPIKDCTENMIIIRQSNENKIYQKDSCVFIEGTKEELIKITDFFILKTIGLD